MKSFYNEFSFIAQKGQDVVSVRENTALSARHRVRQAPQAHPQRTTLERYPVKIIGVEQELTLQAAHYKSSYKMSFADAFAAALAKQKKAELVTGDKDFKPLNNEIKILWL